MIWKCHASVSTNFWNRLFSRDFVFLSSLFVKTFLRQEMQTTCSKQGKLWKWKEVAAFGEPGLPPRRVKMKRDWCFGENCFLPYFLSSPITWSFSLSKRLSFFICLEEVCTLPLVSFHWALDYSFSKDSCFSVTCIWHSVLLISMKASKLCRVDHSVEKISKKVNNKSNNRFCKSF